MENQKQFIPYRNNDTNVIPLEKGKLPPQAIEMEEAVLGAMMIDKKGVDTVIDLLSPEMFYKEAHRHIYAAIYKLFTDNQPIDLLTVSTQLRKDGNFDVAGGEFYLITLTQKNSIISTH